jgi:hypothetical protein
MIRQIEKEMPMTSLEFELATFRSDAGMIGQIEKEMPMTSLEFELATFRLVE